MIRLILLFVNQLLVVTFLLFAIFSHPVQGEDIRGVYGIPSTKTLQPSTYIDHLQRARINTVFVHPDEDTIQWFKAQGFTVCLSVNAFGGKGAWEKYPDSRPVKADGTLLGSEPGYKGYGGVCPTHQAWRKDRINRIVELITRFGQADGVDGIWIDYIRYPGLWEVKQPTIPDTCYCPSCLNKFRHDTNIKAPSRLKAKDAASWINEHFP